MHFPLETIKFVESVHVVQVLRSEQVAQLIGHFKH